MFTDCIEHYTLSEGNQFYGQNGKFSSILHKSPGQVIQVPMGIMNNCGAAASGLTSAHVSSY
jgi:hypothetical protein